MSREHDRSGSSVSDGNAADVAVKSPGRSTPSSKRYAVVSPKLRRKATGPMPAQTDATAVAKQGLSGGASELPHRTGMEQAFGVSLEGVRAHVGPEAAQSNQALRSEAYTYGNDVAFRSSSPSQATVAHEVTHVLQQSTGTSGSEASDEAQAHRAETNIGAAMAPQAKEHSRGATSPTLRFLKVRDDVDQDKLVKAGGVDKLLDADKVATAIKYNNRKWTGDYKTQVVAWLRGGAAAEGASFNESDVQKAAKIQKGAGCDEKNTDGMIGDSSMSIFLHAGLTITEDSKVAARSVTLLFYPGEFEKIEAWQKAKEEGKARDGADADYNEYRSTIAPDGTGRIYVKVSGTVVASYDARGGPAVKLKDGTHTADPSAAGSYRLSGGGPKRSNSWYNSQVRWGAEIRKTAAGEIEFKDPGASKWRFATGDKCTLKWTMKVKDFKKPDGTLMATWDKNDFGANAWSVGARGMFVHTTPRTEKMVLAGRTPELATSHGCIHINPAEREDMMVKGYLQAGVAFIIKKYDAHLMPSPMRGKVSTPKP